LAIQASNHKASIRKHRALTMLQPAATGSSA
jgi:hypothetical protein